jgi:parallel beta-helix repeat protein
MHRSVVRAVAVVVPAMCAMSFAVTTAHASATLVVDDNLQCPGAAYTTISSAVAAASAGDTIQVCAGFYPETVTVDKQLTFAGAHAGVDARHARGSPATEAIVDNVNGGFIIGGAVNGVKIDGFTIEGAGNGSTIQDGVEAFQGSSGLSLVNNIIRDNLEGINFQNPDGNQPALIEHNNFINNNNGNPSPEGGTGVFISNGPANSTTIIQNRFTGHRQTAINFAGSSNHSVGLVVDGNQSVNDATFVVAINSDNALIDSNSVTFSGSTNGTAILDFGSNNDLRIMDNTINGGNGSMTSGIKLADFSGAPSVGTTVIGNRVMGRNWGIRIAAPISGPNGYTSALISGNTVTGSVGIGIWVQSSSSGNAITHNTVTGTTGTFACEDDTTGPLTAGTANHWSRDSGGTTASSPQGICSIH